MATEAIILSIGNRQNCPLHRYFTIEEILSYHVALEKVGKDVRAETASRSE